MSGTGIEDRVALISRIVRESLTIRTDDPEFFRRTAKRWGMPPASFNRLKDTGRAGHVNYRIAEMGLGLPRGLFLAIREGDYETVRARAAELEDPELRSLILTTLNLAGGSPRKRTPRKAGNGP